MRIRKGQETPGKGRLRYTTSLFRLGYRRCNGGLVGRCFFVFLVVSLFFFFLLHCFLLASLCLVFALSDRSKGMRRR